MKEPENRESELTDPARRAGAIVIEHINSVIDAAERQADEVRREAERDAEATRRNALESARRVFERIDALERPLGELVQNLRLETDQVDRELPGHVDVETPTIASESESTAAAESGDAVTAIEEPEEPVEAPPATATRKQGSKRRRNKKPAAEPEASSPQEAEGPAAEADEAAGGPEADADQTEVVDPTGSVEEGETAGEEALDRHLDSDLDLDGDLDSDETADIDETAPDQSDGSSNSWTTAISSTVAKKDQPTTSEPEPANLGGRLLARFRASVAPSEATFITTEGHCAVCQKTFMAGSEENLKLSDWKVSGDVGLCPECQGDSWQLPKGARLPFRQGGG